MHNMFPLFTEAVRDLFYLTLMLACVSVIAVNVVFIAATLNLI